MAVLEASRPSTSGEREGDDGGPPRNPFELDPTPLELAHLLAELNFLRAQLAVLQSELNPRSGDSGYDEDDAELDPVD